MSINIQDPVNQTIFFSVFFLFWLFLSVKKNQNRNFFSKEVTNQLKGFAILSIVFAHIGYFLSSDQRFLYPYSVLGGMGVNLFLFLSGFGLTLSQIKSPLSPLAFYKKRLPRLFIPLWIVIAIFLLVDFFVLNRTYPLLETVKSFLGFYPRADLWQNLDSPLWYFSIIFFYYLLFPILFIRKAPFVSAGLILTASLILLNQPLPVVRDVLTLYKLHTLAFPLGIIFGWAVLNIHFKLNKILKILIFTTALLILLYTSINSYVGQGLQLEQGVSLITTLSVVTIFILLPFRFKLFSAFGFLSYEIYLLHWTILSRYNLFTGLSPYLMVILNLILFVVLAFALQKCTEKI